MLTDKLKHKPKCTFLFKRGWCFYPSFVMYSHILQINSKVPPPISKNTGLQPQNFQVSKFCMERLR